VVTLAQECQDINKRRASLDHAFLSLSEQDSRRDELWVELAALADELIPAVNRLAATTSADAADLRHKAAVLAVLLRTDIDVSQPEISALALSVAEDVARLV
jgi:hypothetical protein